MATPSTTTLTFRLDSDLKDQVDAAAQAQGISTTEFVARALRAAQAALCPTCGRSSLPSVVPVAFAPAFEEWVATCRKVNPNGPVIVTTVEEGAAFVYWARLRHEPLVGGQVMLDVLFDHLGRKYHSIGVPRGLVTSWRDDGEGHWYNNHRLLGYEDGNVFVRNQVIAAQAREQGIVVARPRRPSRLR